jgi:hypothetical protein
MNCSGEFKFNFIRTIFDQILLISWPNSKLMKHLSPWNQKINNKKKIMLICAQGTN